MPTQSKHAQYCRKYRETHLEQERARGRAAAAEHREERAAYNKEWALLHQEERKAYHTQYDAEHKDERATYRKNRYQNTREQQALQNKQYQKDNREKIKARKAARYLENREHIIARTIAYIKAHPEQAQARNATRRARKLHAPVNDFTALQWREMQAAYDHRCVYCKKRRKGKLTQDHIQPLSKSGSHTVSNIVPACKPCNCKKHTGPVLVPIQPLML